MDRRIRKERIFSTIVRSPATYVILIGFFLLFAYSAIGTYRKSKLAKEKTRYVEERLRELGQEESSLKASLYDMNTPFGVEKSLREKFGIIKEGEVAVIIVDPIPTPEDVENQDKESGFFGFLKNIF